MKIFINSRFLGPRCARSHAFRSHLILTKSPRVRLIRAYTFSPKFLLPRISLVVVEQGFNRVITIIYFVISMTQHDEEEHVSSSLPFHHEKAHNGSHGTRSFLPLSPNFPRSPPPQQSSSRTRRLFPPGNPPWLRATTVCFGSGDVWLTCVPNGPCEMDF